MTYDTVVIVIIGRQKKGIADIVLGILTKKSNISEAGARGQKTEDRKAL